MEFNGITLVTGAAGFMGSHLVEYLAKKGVRVRATARPRKDTSFFDRLGVEYVPADLTKPETLPPLFKGGVDRIFHLGAICNFSTPYEKLYPTNVLGVERITALAHEHGVKRYVHVGSTSVYGYYKGTPFKEDGPREPADSYGRSKRDGEDVAGAVDHLSYLDSAVGQAYNIAEDYNPSIEEALGLAAKAFGMKMPGLHLPLWLVKLAAKIDGAKAARKGRIPDLEYDAVKYLYHDYVVDNSKLKAAGYRMLYPDFRESMKQMGDWYRARK